MVYTVDDITAANFRIEQLEEAVQLVKSCFTEEQLRENMLEDYHEFINLTEDKV